MLHIPDVLTSEEAAQLRDRLVAAQWVDGNATSGAGAAEAKRNRQLPEDAPATHAAAWAAPDRELMVPVEGGNVYQHAALNAGAVVRVQQGL